MKISVSHEQLAALAQAIDNQTGDGERGYDLIARTLWFKGKDTLLTPSDKKEPGAALCDWRESDEFAETDSPISEPIPVTVRQEKYFVDIYVGGAHENPHGNHASSVRIEREGAKTRVMIFDSLCEAPRTFAIEDGKPLAEAENDWEAMDEGPEPSEPTI